MSSPGKSNRAGLSIMELMDMFPSEDSARDWFESARWSGGRVCPHCGSMETVEVKSGKPMLHHCPDCRKYFSVKTGTVMHGSNLPLRKWVIAIYLLSTSLKGVSSMMMHRDIGVTQKTAWMVIHKIREGWLDGSTGPLSGTVEFDETYIGGKRKNMHKAKRAALDGRGAVGKETQMALVARGMDGRRPPAAVAGAYGMSGEDKRGRGRPPKEVERIPATAEEIRDAIFRAADRKPKGDAGEQPA